MPGEEEAQPLPRVAIVGRPNVGKSTLFNRLAGRRLALVDDTPGVTRDRRDAAVQLGDLHFRLTDTAGYEACEGADLAARIQAQTDRAIAEADAILFVFDARTGLTALERVLADRLRRARVPVVLVANKCEGRSGDLLAAEGHALGLGHPLPVSAEHGDGLGLLFDALAPLLANVDAAGGRQAGQAVGTGEHPAGEADAAATERTLQLAVVGRPNVGKSTLINRLIGDERLVTGPEAGITRDAISLDWSWQGRPLKLFDTAGLRRRARVDDRLEALAGADTQRAIRFAHVVVLVIDAVAGLERQDLSIADAVVEEGRAPVLAINKWDLVEDRSRTLADIRERIESSLPQVRGLRFVTLSAATGEGVARLLPEVFDVYTAWTRSVPTGRLNRFLQQLNHRQPPPSVDGRPLRARYITQLKARPPSFALFVNRPDAVPEAWLRFLANSLREQFGFNGVPLRMSVRRTRNPYAAD